MAEPPDENHLPVTEEVGSEGGSYADPTVQVATRTGQLPRVGRAVPDTSPPGAIAGAVAPTPEGPEDGVRAHYAPDKEAENSESHGHDLGLTDQGSNRRGKRHGRESR